MFRASRAQLIARQICFDFHYALSRKTKRTGKRFKAIGYLSNGVKGIGSLLTMGIHGVEKGLKYGTNKANSGLRFTGKAFVGNKRRRTRRKKIKS